MRQTIPLSLKALGKQAMRSSSSRRALAIAAAAGSSSARRSCLCSTLYHARSGMLPPRTFATSASRMSGPSNDFSDREYHEISDETMDTLTEKLEAVQEELAHPDFDVEYSSGVLTVKLPQDKGIYVINKQPPNKQIWLSSPKSGPKRFDWSAEDSAWIYQRDGSRLLDLLQAELTEKLEVEVALKD